MSDSRLRELERRWKETGDVEDEAALLAEHIRAGSITLKRLRPAAYLGHEASMRIFNASNPGGSTFSFPQWVENLGIFGREVVQRAAIASTASTLTLRQFEKINPEDCRTTEKTLLAAIVYMLFPNQKRKPVLRRLTDQVWSSLASPCWSATFTGESLLAEQLISAAKNAQMSANRAAQFSSEAVVREAIRESVIPWTLGRADPVEELYAPLWLKCQSAQSEHEGDTHV